MEKVNSEQYEEWTRTARAAGVLAGQMAQVQSSLVDLAAEVLESGIWAGDGVRSPEHWLMLMCALSPAHAADVVRVARRRPEFPELAADFEAGRVSLDQMAVVTKHVPAEYSEAVTEFTAAATVPQLRRVLSRYQFGLPAAAASPEDEVPPEQGTARIVRDGPALSMYTHDGRFRLAFECDALDGALVDQAVREAKDALFTAGDETASLADGLLEMASRSLSSVTSESRRSHYRVLVHLSADGHGWVNRRGALPQHLMDKLTCDGTVRPVLFEGAEPVSVGRAQRIIPQRTRSLVEDRDRGCRFPACTASGFLENHHITHWSRGGRSDMDSVVSLCSRHHREHHQGLFSIAGDPNLPDGLVFRGHGGWDIEPVVPERVPPAPPPPEEPQPTKGWPMDTSCIRFTPNRASPQPV